MIIRPENTAIVNGVSKSALEVEKIYSPGFIVLDYGAGKLRNSNYLLSKEIIVHILDTPYQLERTSPQKLAKYEKIYNTNDEIYSKYDIVLCSFVLNVIPEQQIRDNVVRKCNNIITKDGYFVLEVRRSRGIMENKNLAPYNDGFIVGKGEVRTFQKPYNDKEVEALLIANDFTVIKVWNENDSVIGIAKK